jgi:nucleotide-binding universal stress UspA family protein
MSGIICALRGGPDSQVTIDRAIALSKETALPLFFLYVVNLDFLTRTSSSSVQIVSREMEQMGEFILLAAEASAQGQGIGAQRVIRHGNVLDEIAALCRSLGADYLVLGRPQMKHPENIFTTGMLRDFIQRIEAQTGSKVVLPDNGT